MKRITARWIFAVILFFAGARAANAQAQTTVTATVTDPNGIPYAGGTVKAQINPPGPPSPCVVTGGNCVPIQGVAGPQPLDSTGSFTMNLYPNASITPAATTWIFTVCISPGVPLPQGTGPQCFSVSATIAGASQSLSSALSAAAPALAHSSTPLPTGPSTGLLAPQQGLVQSATGQNGTSGAIPAVVLVNNVVKGDMLFASEQGHVSSAPTVGVSDTLGNTWTPLPAAGSSGGNTAQIQTFYAIAKSSGADSMQITMSGPATFDLTLVFSEYAGINTLDQSVSALSTSSGNITTTQPNEVLVAFGSAVTAGNNKFPIMAAGGGANNYSARAIAANGNNNNNSVGSILEDNLAPTTGTYSAGFNNGGEATAGTVIQLASFYSSAPLGSLFRPLAWSDLQTQPINLNCIPGFSSMGCLNLKLDASSGAGVSRISFATNTCGNISTGQAYSPICVEIPILHAADTDRIFELATGGPDTQCNFGWRMDGDGFLVMDGTCPIAITNPFMKNFGELLAQNGLNTSVPDLIVGGSTVPHTGGAHVMDGFDDSVTPVQWLVVPDVESVTNHPSFPTGVTVAVLDTSTNCLAAGTNAAASAVTCGSAAAGMFSIPITTPTSAVITTTALTANSEIFVRQRLDTTNGAGAALSVTCNTTANATFPNITARTTTSFTITFAAFSTNPGCYQYHIIN